MAIKKYHVSKNLAPPMSNGWVDGYVNASTGGITQPTAANEKTSDYIDVHQYSYVSNCYENGDFPSRGTSTSTTAWYGLGCYREDKSFISRLINNLTYQLPAGTYYVRMCFRTFGETGNVMVNGGDTQLPYEPYGNTWTEIPYYLHNTSTDTITTLPADIYANAATATVGLKGQTVQSGTPSPQNPVMPEGTGERTGNLIEGMFSGSIGTTGGIAYSDQYVICYVPVTSGETYTISGNYYVYAYYSVKPTTGISSAVDNERHFTSQGKTITVISGASWVGIRAPSGNIPMVNVGSTALPYEPYGYKIPISSANTTTPVYLGEIESTRRIKKYEFTGQETVMNAAVITATDAYQFRAALTNYKREKFICSHMPVNDDSTSTQTHCYIGQNPTLCFDKTMGLDTTDKVKSYLAAQYAAGTPVTVWYVLATPTTGIVNEPLMKIGDYADEVSNISIPVTAGGDTISVGTTVQPSEVTANYKGWHPKTPKESNNGQ